MITSINKIIYILNLFLKSKKIFSKPKKKKFIIIDQRHLLHVKGFIKDLIKKSDLNILPIRGEEINIYVLLYSFYKFNIDPKNIQLNYIISYIYLSQAKCCITLNHTRILFYKLKEYHKKLITISLQNGHIHVNDKYYKFSNELKKQKNKLKADYIFTQSKFFEEKFFKKYIDAKYFDVGSYRNNFYLKKNKLKKNVISFISQFRFHLHTKKSLLKGGFYDTEKKILPLIYNFCKKNKFRLEILGSEWDEEREKNFYKSILYNNDWVFHKRTSQNKSYNFTDTSELNIFVDSNLGFESLARGNKTVSFNFRKSWNKSYYKWNLDFLNDKGKFWTNTYNISEFNRIMKYGIHTNLKNWKKDNIKVINKLMTYDPKNSKIKKIINKI